MKTRTIFCFVLFLVFAFLLPSISPLLAAWDDPSNKPDFFLGNTEEFKVQNVFINGKPLNPSIYFFTIHREVFVPVRIVTYALGRKVTWDPVDRKVFINGKELNTTRVILGPTCYVSLRSIGQICNAQVAYDTKNHSAAIWAKHPAELGYPEEKWYKGTNEYYNRMNAKATSQRELKKLDEKRRKMEEMGVDPSLTKDDGFVKQYDMGEVGPPAPNDPVPDNNKGPQAPPPPITKVPVAPQPVVTPPPAVAPPAPVPQSTPKGPDPFNFGF